MSDDPRHQAMLAWIKNLAKEMEGLTADEIKQRTKEMREFLVEDRKKRQSG